MVWSPVFRRSGRRESKPDRLKPELQTRTVPPSILNSQSAILVPFELNSPSGRLFSHHKREVA